MTRAGRLTGRKRVPCAERRWGRVDRCSR